MDFIPLGQLLTCLVDMVRRLHLPLSSCNTMPYIGVCNTC